MHFSLSEKPILLSSLIWFEYLISSAAFCWTFWRFWKREDMLFWGTDYDELELGWLTPLLERRGFGNENGFCWLFGKFNPFWLLPNPDPIIGNMGLLNILPKGFVFAAFVPGALLFPKPPIPPNPPIPPSPPIPPRLPNPPSPPPNELDNFCVFYGLTLPVFCISLAILIVSLSNIRQKLT